MVQAVEEGTGEPLITEDFQPAVKFQILGYEQTTFQIALGKSLEEQPCTSGVKGTKPTSSTMSRGVMDCCRTPV